ncbi:hypothetical protein OSB04_010955 [Centaurea solstitialis]|uniref:Uncharacterized protein n=1 Tax=Centaurea solstitialis TaxID=347529 RepID=A0AA38WPR0_9ASTR|nr:hypothetical protein OSB04_010955 [Centaurea solstitialis]
MQDELFMEYDNNPMLVNEAEEQIKGGEEKEMNAMPWGPQDNEYMSNLLCEILSIIPYRTGSRLTIQIIESYRTISFSNCQTTPYSRFNILFSKCKRSGVIKTNEGNNMLFLKSLGTEWLHLTMSIRTNLDLEIMSLADLYGSLASLEPQVLQLKSSIGGPLAFMAEGAKGTGENKPTEERKKKKKELVTESEDAEDMSLEEEMSMRDMMKTLGSFTRDCRRGSVGRGRARDELVTDESSGEDQPQKGLVAFEEAEAEAEFCGVANGDSDSTSSKSSEVSSCSKINELYSEIIENLDSHQEVFNNLKGKLTLCE